MSAKADVLPETRAIGDEEVEHFRQHGWVKLERLISPAFAAEMLERFHRIQRSGVDASSNLGDVALMFEIYDYPSSNDELLRGFAYSPELARVASRLIRARDLELGGLSGEVRLFLDQMLIKQPAKDAGERTPWHQDITLVPLDRAGGLVIWIALVDIPPERGSMRFLSGTHRMPALGRVFNTTRTGDLVDQYPGLQEHFKLSPPLTLRPGDATVHDYCVVHSAAQNTTKESRYAFLVEYIPAEALYTGQPFARADGLGLQINAPLECEKFPRIQL